jgi:cytosine/adenosine deaminase-related metal-dependent hydrolase
MLEFATVEGARSLGLGQVTGSLTPGKRADLLLVRTDTAATAPLSDAAGAVLLQAGTGDIETVIVDGRLRKHEGRLVDADAPALFARLQARAEAMAEAARRG